jgi:hypothetical protein
MLQAWKIGQLQDLKVHETTSWFFVPGEVKMLKQIMQDKPTVSETGPNQRRHHLTIDIFCLSNVFFCI